MKRTKLIAWMTLAGFAFAGLAFMACDRPSPTGEASQARLKLSANPDRLPADGEATSQIVVQILDIQGHAASGVVVRFEGSLGSLDPVGAVTTDDGYANTVFTAGTTAGNGRVTVKTDIPDTLENFVEIDLYEADPELVAVNVASQADEVKAGESVDFVVSLTDDTGAALADYSVSIRSSAGIMIIKGAEYNDYYGKTGSNGKVEGSFVAGTTTGAGSVSAEAYTADSEKLEGTKAINVVANDPYLLTLSGRTSLTDCGYRSISIYITCADKYNNAVKDGTFVTFDSGIQYGSLSSSSVSLASGTGSTTYTGDNRNFLQSKNDVITGRVSGFSDVTDSLTITLDYQNCE